MGQKVNPIDMRIGITHTWPSRWYAGKKQYAKNLGEDIAVRNFLKNKFKDAGVAKIEIERNGGNISVVLFSARPGMIIGRSGEGIEDVKKALNKKFAKPIDLSIREVKDSSLDAEIMAESVAFQLVKRIAFRRAAKSTIKKAMDFGAKGIKVEVSGRLGGADIARKEFFTEGKIPLHTLRADISYAKTRAETTYGTIGVKVWIFKGEVFRERAKKQMIK